MGKVVMITVAVCLPGLWQPLMAPTGLVWQNAGAHNVSPATSHVTAVTMQAQDRDGMTEMG